MGISDVIFNFEQANKEKPMKIIDVQALALAVPLATKTFHSSLAGRLSTQVVVRIVSEDGNTGKCAGLGGF